MEKGGGQRKKKRGRGIFIAQQFVPFLVQDVSSSSSTPFHLVVLVVGRRASKTDGRMLRNVTLAHRYPVHRHLTDAVVVHEGGHQHQHVENLMRLELKKRFILLFEKRQTRKKLYLPRYHTCRGTISPVLAARRTAHPGCTAGPSESANPSWPGKLC